MNNTPSIDELQHRIDAAADTHPKYWKNIGTVLGMHVDNTAVVDVLAQVRSRITPDMWSLAGKLGVADASQEPTPEAVLQAMVAMTAQRPQLERDAANANGEMKRRLDLIGLSYVFEKPLTNLAKEKAEGPYQAALSSKEVILERGNAARAELTKLMNPPQEVTVETPPPAKTTEPKAKPKAPGTPKASKAPVEDTASAAEKAAAACERLADIVQKDIAVQNLLTYEIKVVDDKYAHLDEDEKDAHLLEEIDDILRDAASLIGHEEFSEDSEQEEKRVTLKQVRDTLNELFAPRKTLSNEKHLLKLHHAIRGTQKDTLKGILSDMARI